MRSGKDNLEKFHKLHHVNPGLVFFAFVFLYVAVCIYISSKESSIVGYQIKNGMLSENRIYTGIALRDENVVTSEGQGYVALFVSEGERAAFNNLVYAIDQSGKISDLTTKDPNEDTFLSDKELSSLKQDIMLFSKEFNKANFEDAVVFENTISEEMARLENRSLLASVEEINSLHINDVINFYRISGSGIVTFFEDGYENKTADMINPEDFDKENYNCNYVYNDTLLETGDFVYKYTNNELWSLCIFVPDKEMDRIHEGDYVDVRFSKTNNRSWGLVHIVKNCDKGSIVSLTFTNSMVTFARDRFVEVELLLEEDTGLKVPNSAIAENSFFLIDKDFVLTDVNDADYGVNVQVISDSGNVTTKFMEVTVYKETDDCYYVAMSGLKAGDTLYYVSQNGAADTSTTPLTFTVGKQGTLIGVYNINKGFADFKQIEVLYSNDEYSIIKSNTTTGLRAYDYIALDASVVTDKDFVY